MTPLAYLTPDRRLRVRDDQGDRSVSGMLEGIQLGTWGAPANDTPTHSWPTWSPSGLFLARFTVEPDKQARIAVSDTLGVTSEELANLEDRLPIYMQWDEDDERLALLTQRREALALSMVRRGRVGHEAVLLEGSPMFFTWWNGKLAVFYGGESGSRLVVVDPEDGSQTTMPRFAGNFCAPVAVGERLAYVARSATGGPMLVTTDLEHNVEELAELDGLVAMVASPDRRRIAVATADSDSAPYRNLFVIDVDTGARTAVTDAPCLAYFWNSDGTELISASVDTERNTLRWNRVALDGELTFLMEIHPTRDLGFYLRFFEQYAQSHRLVSADGKDFVVVGASPSDSENRPYIWRVPLDGGEPEPLAEGMFAVYAERS